MSKAVKCPICEGKGKVAPEGVGWSGSPDSYPLCHGCSGKGWVEVGMSDYEKREQISPYKYSSAEVPFKFSSDKRDFGTIS